MSTEQERDPNKANEFRNRLFWRWADEMPRPLREGFLKTMHALGAGANAAGRMVFRDGTPITMKQIARAACVDQKDARRYIDAGQAAGLVTMTGERKRGSTPVYAAVVVDSPNWAAAVEWLRATKAEPKRRTPRVWEEGSKGDAPSSPSGEGTGDAPHSENGGCTPEGMGDAPGTSQGYPRNYPKNSGGDGRQASTGSRASGSGGCAAADSESGDEVSFAAVAAVVRELPKRLRDQIDGEFIPAPVVGAIRTELARGVTATQLVTRAKRRYLEFGIERDIESMDGEGARKPVGALIALVRAGRCTSARCDDGTDLDTGADCRTCEREAEDRRPAEQGPVQGAFPVTVPTPPTAPAPQPRRQRLVARDCENRVCPVSFPAAPAPAPAGLCPECAQGDRKAGNA